MATDTDIVVSIGAGGIGEAITRRQGFGKSLLLVNISGKTLAATASALRAASYKVEARLVDVKFRNSVRALAEAALSLGHVTQIINTAGLSPNMAPVAQLLKVDLYGTAPAWRATCCWPLRRSRTMHWPTPKPMSCSTYYFSRMTLSPTRWSPT